MSFGTDLVSFIVADEYSSTLHLHTAVGREAVVIMENFPPQCSDNTIEYSSHKRRTAFSIAANPFAVWGITTDSLERLLTKIKSNQIKSSRR